MGILQVEQNAASKPIDSLYLQNRYNEFLRKAISSGFVFTLSGDDGIASINTENSALTSGNYVSDNPAHCFWAHPASAIMCRHFDWIEYEIMRIPVARFISDWCPGMSDDDVLVAPNPDYNRDCLHLNPDTVARDLIRTADAAGAVLTLRNQDYIHELARKSA